MEQAILLDPVKLTNTNNVTINPATDDAVTFLRRLLQISKALAVVDVANRQKVTIDAITSGIILSNVTTVANTTALGGVDYRYQIKDHARNAYANSIRAHLSFH